MSQTVTSTEANAEFRQGLLFGLAAYGMWGFLPAYYKLTDTVPADLVVSHRILWSVLFVGLFLYSRGRWQEVREVFRQPKVLMGLTASATFIAVNWLTFVWAISNNHVLDISLGYFINPLVSILVGLFVLREKLTTWQGISVGVAAIAVVLQAILAGGLPWVSLVLAFSFAGYGYVRKVTPVKATPGLFVETLVLFPLAAGYMLLSLSWGVDAMVLNDPPVLLALVGTGIVTALPLICFSSAARRLPLFMLGLMQYMAPSMHFLMAIYIWGEPLDPTKLMTFGMIWAALVVFTYDSWRRYRS
ncbi:MULTISPECIES: EamA family transporter RarD [Stappiaceae]|jgi:chloramphenicol-sensitive protein RarD|uniref:Permease n=2 Tax=Roseibium TaxID=150830 RepID=A0ABM6HWI6_9HYPH|nr:MULTISPECIES: EamA family transporter RarD [Stappiaceae]MCR9282506.1 EamA family transporter RarD [Paracoccaceae bacterium]MEE2867766.1 EamA family transporter RarD [Pseudomonadota bacterium]AMN53914.1 permease [Labrenzia sp. CP4]AQQ02319.1 permease [Roseibium aggregatum]MBO6856803.1 EamA family transporter RarD [Roseibium sp.]